MIDRSHIPARPQRMPGNLLTALSTAVLVVVASVACSSSKTPARMPSESASGDRTTVDASAEHAGRWLRWRGGDGIWGSFVTPGGVGPHWPLDVAGGASWSTDGRWLVSCTNEFVAARWMGSARPSRIAILGGGCSAIAWAPRTNTAVAWSKKSEQIRLLTFTPGDEPSIAGISYDIGLAEGEQLHAETITWSPAGNGFIAMVTPPRGHWSIRWIDTTHAPGTVRTLVTEQGFEAGWQYPKTAAHLSCWWSPSGVRMACRTWQKPSDEQTRENPPEALALFELEGDRVSSRHLFETRWFSLESLGWLDENRLVFTDRDATRLFDIRGSAPPLILSATAGAFAISPTNSRVAYVNHRGLCLRDSKSDKLGPERVVFPGQVKGVTWSDSGRHLFARRADERTVVVVIDASSEQPRIEQTDEAPEQLDMYGRFSEGSTLLFTRAGPDQQKQRHERAQSEPQPLTIWSLPEFRPIRLIPKGFLDSLLAQSPDDSAVILNSEGEQGLPHLSLIRNAHPTSPMPIGEKGAHGFSFQPGATLTVNAKPGPRQSSDPYRERVPLPPDHPISLGTAYVVGSMKCTGALIDPRYVITAHHCIGDRRVSVTLGRNLEWEQTFVIPQYRIVHHTQVRYLERSDMFEHDLAVLEPPTAAPPQARPFSLAQAEDDVPGSEVFRAGYGGDYAVGLSAQPELRYAISKLVPAGDSVPRSIRWRSAEGADNGGCSGDSGGPVLVPRHDQSFALLGIHYGIDTTDYSQHGRNWGLAGKLPAEREWLNRALDELSMSRRGSGPPRPRPKPL